MGEAYPELRERQPVIQKVTLERGDAVPRDARRAASTRLDGELDELKKTGGDAAPGQERVHDVRHVRVPGGSDEDHRRGARADDRRGRLRRGARGGAGEEPVQERRRGRSRPCSSSSRASSAPTKFLGYDGRGTSGEGTLQAIVVDGKRVEQGGRGRRRRARVRPDAVLRASRAVRSATPARSSSATRRSGSTTPRSRRATCSC